MREILFRGKNDSGEWVYGWLGHLHCYNTRTKEISSIYFTEISDNLRSRLNTIVDYKTVGQFTGLYDSTEWEDLTDAEKLEFYNQHYIGEDGMSVRFQNVDDVRFLWKGKKIFEGDIVKCRHRVVRFSRDELENIKPRRSYGKEIEENDGLGFSFFYWRNYAVSFRDGYIRIQNGSDHHDIRTNYIYNHKIKVIGNIHDNPELLEVSK